MKDKIKIGISSCLLGHKVRFDGGHKEDRFITNVLSRYFSYVPFCPEVGIGLKTPRPAIRLETGDDAGTRLVNPKTGENYTERMNRYAGQTIQKLQEYDISGYIVKRDSPSCGMERVRVYRENKIPGRDGIGIFTKALMEQLPLLPIEEEGRLHDERLRENFITRVYAFHDLQRLLRNSPAPGKLVDFHTGYKLIFMAHSPEAYRQLGKLVALAGKDNFNSILDIYVRTFMQSLKTIATGKKHANVLYHALGYFRNQLTAWEKQELISIIEQYRTGIIPLVVPLTLMNHYRKRYSNQWLDRQKYFAPYPDDLSLRNAI